MHEVSTWPFVVMGFLALLAVALGFLVAVALVVRDRGRTPAPPDDPALALLRQRLASGEIGEDEYLRRRSLLDV